MTGHPWTAQEWGFELLLAVMYRAFQFQGLFLLTLFFSFGLFMELFLLWRLRGASYAQAGILGMLLIFPLLPFLNYRPQEASYLFFEGFFEPVIATIFIVFILSFLNIIQKIPNGAPLAENLLIYYFLIIFISFIVNVIKGLIESKESLISSIGMVVGIYVFYSYINSIAPDAILEVSLYIVGSIVGIIIGILKSK